jgi:hypothetical protein
MRHQQVTRLVIAIAALLVLACAVFATVQA